MSGELLTNYDANKDKLIDPKELLCLHGDLNAVADKLNDPSVLDDCITLLQDSKKDKTPEEQAKYDVVIGLLKSKKDKFVGPRENIAQNTMKVESNPEVARKQGETLETVMDQFDANVLELLQELQSGKVDINNVDNLSVMGNFLRVLQQSPDRKKTMTEFTVSLQKKIDAITDPTQKEKYQKLLTTLQPTIDALADPKSVFSLTADKLGSSIDTHLNGSSYDKLLADANTTDPKNLDTPESKKALAKIFLRDEDGYNTLLTDFNGTDVGTQKGADTLVRKYASLDGRTIPDSEKIISKDIITKDATGKDITKKGFERKDATGTIQTLVFGKDGQPKKFSDLLSDTGPAWLKGKEKGMFDIDINGKMILGTALAGVLGVEGGVAKVLAGKTFSNMFEAIGAFFESPMFDEIKKLFLMLGMFGKEGISEENQTEIAFINAKKAIRDHFKDDEKGGEAIMTKLSSYKWNSLPGSDGKKNINVTGTQKDYFTNYLSLENQINFLDGNPIVSQKKYEDTSWRTDQSVQTKTSTTENSGTVSGVESQKQTGGKELTSGQSDALKLNPSMDATKIKGEVKISDDKKSLLVDNQVVVLQPSVDGKTSSGLIRVRDKDNKGFVEHGLTVDAAGKISFAEGVTPTSLDTSNTKIKETYDAKKMKFPIVPGNEGLFNYFAFSKSVDEKKSNVIDAVYTSLAQDPTAMKDFQTKFAKLQSDFATGNKTAESMKTFINQSGLDTIAVVDPKQKTAFTAALNDWKSIFITEEPKTVAKAPVASTKKKV